MQGCDISVTSEKEEWKMFGYSIPKAEMVYFSQVIALYIVILVCLVNLCIGSVRDDIWVSLLSASIGYLLPNPSKKYRKIIVHYNSI